MPNPWTDAQFTEAVRQSTSIAEVLRRLLRACCRANYEWVHYNVHRLALDTSHWTSKSRKRSERRPLTELLVAHSSYPMTHHLKDRILREGLFKKLECAICKLADWQGKPLTLRLDHINGDRFDHRRSNLRLLCPNCDSQTSTFCGRNKRAGTPLRVVCADCGKPCTPRSFRCKTCFLKQLHKRPHTPKIEWPPNSMLVEKLKSYGGNFCALARELGVTDNAIRKHLHLKT